MEQKCHYCGVAGAIHPTEDACWEALAIPCPNDAEPLEADVDDEETTLYDACQICGVRWERFKATGEVRFHSKRPPAQSYLTRPKGWGGIALTGSILALVILFVFVWRPAIGPKDVEVGDCVSSAFGEVRTSGCDSGKYRVVGKFRMAGHVDFPGYDVLSQFGDAKCPGLDILMPTEESWPDDNDVVCLKQIP